MPESLTPDLIALRETTERFVADTLQPTESGLDEVDSDPQALRTLRTGVVAAAKAAGLFGMTQPKAFGGSEAGQLALTVVRDTLAAHNLRSSRWVFGPGPGVLAGAEGPLRDSHLQPLLDGHKQSAFGFTEPDDAPHPTRAHYTRVRRLKRPREK